VQGNYISTGDFEPVTGFGGGLGFGITDDVNLLLRGSMSQGIENENLINEVRYDYLFATLGVEYIPPIPIFEKYRIYWKNAFNVGLSEFEVSFDNGPDESAGPGLITSFHTGLQYNFTQIIAPYFDLGYHKSFYDSRDDVSIKGLQVAVGVRFYIFGLKDYEQGY
jgi:hypothetical protein